MTPAALNALLAGDMDNYLTAMTPGGIEAQEAAGQQSLVAHKDRLPIIGTIRNRGGADIPDERAKWEAAGFVFGDEIPEQGRRPVFVACTFPPGWRLQATDHSMWSDVIDDAGRKRASVFFKAAFYDYAAHTFGLDRQ